MWKCPKCSSGEGIVIAATVWVRLSYDEDEDNVETEPLGEDGSHEWTDDSLARCRDCDYVGQVKDFYHA